MSRESAETSAPQKTVKNRQEEEFTNEKQTAGARLPSLHGIPNTSRRKSIRRSKSSRNAKRSWFGPMAATERCLNAVEQITESAEGKRNMKNVDGKFLVDMGSRDVMQWSSSLMQEFQVHFTAKVNLDNITV